MNTLRICGAILVALCAVSACGTPSGEGAHSGEGPIKIGVPLPLSGPLAFPGQGEQVGLKLAEAEINANGGINGRDIEFLMVDSQSTPDGAVAAATRLVTQQKVPAILNGGSSGEVIANLPFLRQNDVVNYVVSAADPAITDPAAPNVFRGATLNNKYAAPLYADYLAELGTERVAILQGAYPLYQSLLDPLRQELKNKNIEVVAIERYNLGDTSFAAQIAQIKESGADTVFVMAQLTDALTILPQIKQAGITARLVGDTASADPGLLTIGDAADGFTTFSMGGPQLVTDTTKEMGEFHAALEEYDIALPAKTPNVFSVLAYTDAYVLAEALRNIDGPITTEALVESLETNIDGFQAGTTPEFDYAATIGLPRTFSPDNHDGNRTATPLTVENGEFVPAT